MRAVKRRHEYTDHSVPVADPRHHDRLHVAAAMNARPYAPVKRQILRGLINWLRIYRETIETIARNYSVDPPRVIDRDVLRELALIDGWIKELRAAQQRRVECDADK
jgi:hypothetical protein